MHDPHVTAVSRLFGSYGAATARVAFRTGFSCGSSSVDDVVAAAEALLAIPNVESVLVCGYSYGSIVAMAAAKAIPECLGWVAINPPLDVAWALFLFNGAALLEDAKTALPKLLIHATADQFCANRAFDDFVTQLPEPKLAINVKGASHFDVVRHIPDALTQFITHAFAVDSIHTFVRSSSRCTGVV